MRLNAPGLDGKSPFHYMWQATFTRLKDEFSIPNLEQFADAAIRTTIHRRTPQMLEAVKNTPGPVWFKDHLQHRWGNVIVFQGAESDIDKMLEVANEEVNSYELMHGQLPYGDSDFHLQAIKPDYF